MPMSWVTEWEVLAVLFGLNEGLGQVLNSY